MTTQTTNISTALTAPHRTFLSGVRAGWTRMIDAFVNALECYANNGRFVSAINELEAKTDEELAAMGLKRDQIATHAMRSMYYI